MQAQPVPASEGFQLHASVFGCHLFTKINSLTSGKKSVLSSFFYGISTPRCAHGKFGILFQGERVSCCRLVSPALQHSSTRWPVELSALRT